MGNPAGLPAPDSSTADIELVRRAQRGDRRAFAWLHQRYARMVHAVVLAQVPAAEAEDLVQDVFLAALDAIDGLRETAAVGGWLAAIARHRAADFHRRRRDVVPLDEERAAAAGQGGASAEAMQALAAIRRLPEAYRETLLMRLVEGMSGPEIAEHTGLEPGSVRVNLHRGMKLLRAELGVETAAEDEPASPAGDREEA